jgi:hypothetical protein
MKTVPEEKMVLSLLPPECRRCPRTIVSLLARVGEVGDGRTVKEEVWTEPRRGLKIGAGEDELNLVDKGRHSA